MSAPAPSPGGTPTDRQEPAPDLVSDLLVGLSSRVSMSPKLLRPPAPSAAQWAQAAALALRAPDHGALQPFRFVVVGDSQRQTLAELFAQDAVRRGHPDQEVDKARQRAHNGPGLAALVGRIRPGVDDVPESEQWVCIGAALMNFLNGLHLMGFGSKALSGSSVRAPVIHAAFCRPDEQLVAWVIAGTPRRSVGPARIDRARELIAPWTPE
jgi:nitroreductase